MSRSRGRKRSRETGLSQTPDVTSNCQPPSSADDYLNEIRNMHEHLVDIFESMKEKMESLVPLTFPKTLSVLCDDLTHEKKETRMEEVSRWSQTTEESIRGLKTDLEQSRERSPGHVSLQAKADEIIKANKVLKCRRTRNCICAMLTWIIHLIGTHKV